MILDGITIISGSANANIVCTSMTYATRMSLTNLEPGEIVYQSDTFSSSTPGMYLYTGSDWVQIGNKVGNSTLAQYQITDAYTKTEVMNLVSSKADIVNGTIPVSQLPSTVLNQLSYKGLHDMVVALPTASITNIGNFYIASNTTEQNGYKYGDWAISNGTTWDRLAFANNVSSVNTKTGAVTLTKSDIGLINVDNTSDLDKPISSSVTNALILKANISGATFTGPITSNSTICGATSTELNYLSGVISPIQSQLNQKLSNSNPNISGTLTVTGNIIASIFSDSKGSLRTVPQNLQTSQYTLTTSDIGKHVATSNNVSLPNNVFVTGDTLIILNTSDNPITIQCASTAYIAGSSSVKSTVNLAAKGLCTVLFYANSTAILTGNIF